MAEEEKPDQLAKYNEASLVTGRLHENWLRSGLAIRGNDTFLLDTTLQIIWSDLLPPLLRKSYKQKMLNEKKEIMKELALANKMKVTIQEGFPTGTETESEIIKRTKIMRTLKEYHLWLRVLQDRLGMGSIYKDQDDDDFE